MRKATLLMVLAIVVCLTSGCAGIETGKYTTIGGAAGMAAGTAAAMLLPNVPILQAGGPLGGGVIGAAIGSYFDTKNAKQAAALQNQQAQQMQVQQAQQVQVQQTQMQPQQMQQVQPSTRLSVPATVVTGSNQNIPVRSGPELANILMQLQSGTQFGMLVSRANSQRLIQDMAANGYMSIGAARPYGQNVMYVFQKPNITIATPMPLAQAARMM